MDELAVLAKWTEFLLAHMDLIMMIKNAIDGGASKSEIVKAIEAGMVAASDAEMDRELG